jgi:diadenosine tetraphosphate (Ap4A) HIT family hydrolase
MARKGFATLGLPEYDENILRIVRFAAAKQPTGERIMTACIFCDIVNDAIPASKVYQDETCIAFMDIRPINPGHLLVVPRTHAACLAEVQNAVIGHLFETARKLAGYIRNSGLRVEGINFWMADGTVAGQEVLHLHVHVIPRYQGDGFRLRFGPESGRLVARERLEHEAAAIRAAMGLPLPE